MMTETYTTFLPDETSTITFAADMALILKRGDLITLSGELGAGKTTFARGLIRALADDDALDVPSPTFTLVQQYDDIRLATTHADLYRLAVADDIYELGLIDALETGIVIVEWPQQAQTLMPAASFAISLTQHEQGRLVRIEAQEQSFKRLSRTLAIRQFIKNNGRAEMRRHYLAGDASSRRYEVIEAGAKFEILMDAEEIEVKNGRDRDYATNAHLATNVAPFVAIDRIIRDHGFLAPEIRALDLDNQLLILEDLGQERIYDENRQPIENRYLAGIELLANFQQSDWPKDKKWSDVSLKLKTLDWKIIKTELSLLLDWYLPFKTNTNLSPERREAFFANWQLFLPILAQSETSLIMRDFHAPNILWQNDKEADNRIGLIDFQDALIGPTAYDVVSLSQDARITIGGELEAKLIDRYIECRRRGAKPFDIERFRLNYALMGVQRASKILGIFVRLDQRDAKSNYLDYLPTIKDYLMRNLEHPALTELKHSYQQYGLLDG